ncbi:MAG TPA: hypothetical protein DEP53_04550 [Bacteroidetes bacterium]|nr:hypothetical protein [Bacteroidota bacterium]
MKKSLKWTGITILVVGLGIQLRQPDRTNPSVDESKTIYASMKVPPEVKAVFERSCNDCHSHQTRWPWYSYIAPASWLVADDVKQGRQKLNLSTWADYRKNRKVNRLEEIGDQIKNKEMPLPKYLLLHPSAQLSASDLELITQWAEKEHDRLAEPDSTEGEKK